MNLILSTCGTSILTNHVDEQLRHLLTQHANVKKEDEIPASKRGRIRDHIEQRGQQFARLSWQEAQRDSAELNGILSFYERPPIPSGESHYLLATDTWFGEETAKIAEAWLRKNGVANVNVIRHPDLQTADWQYFRSSLADLVKWCAETIAPQRTEHCRVVFNLSGGFKSETGFLQMLGMFYADETIYMFERSGELMRIPRLPVRMEDEPAIERDLSDFRRAALDLKVHAAKSGIYWFEMDGQSYLTPWGQLVFDQHKERIYRQAIHPPPSDRIVFHNKDFLPSCEKETAIHKQQVNEAIDLLACFLEKDNQPNPNKLNFHSLNKQPKKDVRYKNVTHEFYAWSNDDAKRVYCRMTEEGKVELLFLDKHL